MVGKTFGRYCIQAEEGRGGMGVVYRARDIKLDRLVAIKVLGQHLEAHPAAWGYLLKEAQTASALNHPCICTIYDVGEEGQQPYIAMEYIEGCTLHKLSKPNGLPLIYVTRYGRLIADALAHAHERGIIHRDIKSSNVVITPHRALKILDFGLAKRIRTETVRDASSSKSSLMELERMAGTIHYLAPEVLRGGRATVWSDVWSLGVLLYEMTTGKLPFRGRTVFELATTIMTSVPVSLTKEIPNPLAAVIERCLQRDPADRFQCARDVARALQPGRMAASMLNPARWLQRLRNRLPWNAGQTLDHTPEKSVESYEHAGFAA